MGCALGQLRAHVPGNSCCSPMEVALLGLVFTCKGRGKVVSGLSPPSAKPCGDHTNPAQALERSGLSLPYQTGGPYLADGRDGGALGAFCGAACDRGRSACCVVEGFKGFTASHVRPCPACARPGLCPARPVPRAGPVRQVDTPLACPLTSADRAAGDAGVVHNLQLRLHLSAGRSGRGAADGGLGRGVHTAASSRAGWGAGTGWGSGKGRSIEAGAQTVQAGARHGGRRCGMPPAPGVALPVSVPEPCARAADKTGSSCSRRALKQGAMASECVRQGGTPPGVSVEAGGGRSLLRAAVTRHAPTPGLACSPALRGAAQPAQWPSSWRTVCSSAGGEGE